ncbi:pyridoxal phosphate-dependent decarboxylase family protein [Phaeodactylibacter luteus]|nr:pyridoxal-dependent decarboxylase [Phaeodactylibacter luteus]
MHKKMRHWKKHTPEQVQARVFEALAGNVDYRERSPLGLPASHLDEKVFTPQPSLLREAPFLSTLIQNPNHIGCHTLGDSESFFAGTQELERELIALCAEDILQGAPGGFDGYVAAGGTEANIQAAWVYRNYFQREKGASAAEVAILTSSDAHYSMHKAANLLGIRLFEVAVGEEDRSLSRLAVEQAIERAQAAGVRYFIVVCNMMTTMFGSVDKASVYLEALQKAGASFKMHVDGAYGGFFFPFSEVAHDLHFGNEAISSITLDAHKMVQAPYGTGIFLARKGLMKYAYTEEAQYVQGLDATLSGSRSGANAISVWMILMTYGPHGWHEKIHILNYRTAWLCRQLSEKKVPFYRHPGSNIVTVKSSAVKAEAARKYSLIPDSHGQPSWYKFVVMDHVTIDRLGACLQEL